MTEVNHCNLIMPLIVITYNRFVQASN